jgi:hypothetical protein
VSRTFITHSSTDNDPAIALRDWLVGEGWDNLFLDLDPELGITAGERSEQALNEAARRCDAVLFLSAWLGEPGPPPKLANICEEHDGGEKSNGAMKYHTNIPKGRQVSNVNRLKFGSRSTKKSMCPLLCDASSLPTAPNLSDLERQNYPRA